MTPKVLMAALAIAYLHTTSAQADPEASMELTIEGHAEEVCVLPEPQHTQLENAGFSGQVIEIDQMIDASDATLNSALVRLKFPDVMCNYAAKVSLTTVNGGLVRTGAGQTTAASGSGEFLETVDYRLNGSWGGVALPDISTQSVSANHTASVQADGANRADLIIDITVDSNATPVLTGQYSDDIRLKVGLQP